MGAHRRRRYWIPGRRNHRPDRDVGERYRVDERRFPRRSGRSGPRAFRGRPAGSTRSFARASVGTVSFRVSSSGIFFFFFTRSRVVGGATRSQSASPLDTARTMGPRTDPQGQVRDEQRHQTLCSGHPHRPHDDPRPPRHHPGHPAAAEPPGPLAVRSRGQRDANTYLERRRHPVGCAIAGTSAAPPSPHVGCCRSLSGVVAERAISPPVRATADDRTLIA